MAKKAKQLALPGMQAPKRVKKEVEKPTSSGKFTDKLLEKDKLRGEMVAGNRPMFMTASEIVRLSNLGDAGYRSEAPLERPKTERQKSREQNLLTKKLKESKTGTTLSSHSKREHQDGWTIEDGKEMRVSELPSLHESIAKEGFKGSFPLLWNRHKRGPIGEPGTTENYLNVFEGHHRLAAMRNLHPKQFMPIKWRH